MKHVRALTTNRPAVAQLETLIQLVGLMQTLIFLPVNLASSFLSQAQQLTSLVAQWQSMFGLDLANKEDA